ncbi:hypothetical protein VTN77DRAFT_5820 [Rasamsonia byssochlamydoides]|uniref:uncharacterized protein n=1 Tax=Rasamsonia byssochlamydoides TaxID=89139 RepID=UPI003743583C
MSSSQIPAAAAPVTTTSGGVYSAQPAFPLLASSLLSPRYQQRNGDDHAAATATATTTATATDDRNPTTTTWNLKADFEKGLRTRTEEDSYRHVFRCGVTIGFSWLKEGNSRLRSAVDQDWEEKSRERLGELPRRLLASLLSRSRNESNIFSGLSSHSLQSSPQPKAFIIHPSNSRTFAPEALLQSILSLDRHLNSRHERALLSRDEAITLLDAVQLLAVYDFPSAVQAISQVSDALHRLQQERRQQQQQRQQEQQGEVLEEDAARSSKERGDGPILLIVEGLDTLTESVIRTSNPLRGSALLMPALRTLTHLSRTYASFLSVMLVNTLGLGGAAAHSKGPSTDSAGGSLAGPLPSAGPSPSADGGLYSIFSRSSGPSGSLASSSSSLLPTLLSRTLDQGIDTHLLLSSVKGRPVVEVIKDRTGDSVGKWCVWE